MHLFFFSNVLSVAGLSISVQRWPYPEEFEVCLRFGDNFSLINKDAPKMDRQSSTPNPSHISDQQTAEAAGLHVRQSNLRMELLELSSLIKGVFIELS